MGRAKSIATGIALLFKLSGNRNLLQPRNVRKNMAIAVLKNIAMGIGPLRALRVRKGRTVVRAPDRDGLETYAYKFLDEVRTHTGELDGKRVLEIGPGDNLLAGLAFLAAGAASYAAIDRFQGAYDNEVAHVWYRALRADWANRYPDLRWPDDLDPEAFVPSDRVTALAGGVEEVSGIGAFDLVCSFVVAEHVLDPASFANLTREAIGDHGEALHVIDFSGHEWDQLGDPFLFLKFSDRMWRWMGSNRGVPNRVRFDEYLRHFEHAGLAVEVVHRREVEFDPRDTWVAERAEADFLTHWAVFKMRSASFR